MEDVELRLVTASLQVGSVRLHVIILILHFSVCESRRSRKPVDLSENISFSATLDLDVT